MPEQISRRETLRRGLAAASVLALVPEWALPALAQGDMDVPFTDYPANYKTNGNPNAVNRMLDIRTIDGYTTPNDQFFFIQHYNRPEVDANTTALEIHRNGQQADRTFAGRYQGHEGDGDRERLRVLRQQRALV